MTDKAVFTALAEILEVPNQGPDSNLNPYLTVARFVFADDKGAPLSTTTVTPLQGIEVEDFDEVIRTSLHMPVKMKFNGDSIESHSGSYVVGHITNMTKQTDGDRNQLIADAVLYAEEYPEEVKFLKEAHASGDAPGISYEVAYSNSVIKNGVEWIKGLITCAATFVKSPAYGKRTALLALASAKSDEEFLITMKGIVAHAEEKEAPTPTIEGGINVDELEKAQQDVEKFKAEAETKTAEIDRLMETINAKDAEIATLNQTVSTLHSEKTLESRTRMFSEAGFMLEADAEKAEKKKSFWLTLSDEVFEEYLADLVAAKAMASAPVDDDKKKKAEAAAKLTQLPRPEVNTDGLEVPSFRFRE